MFPTDRAALETALARVLDVAVEFATLGEYRLAPLPEDAHGTASASAGTSAAPRTRGSSEGQHALHPALAPATAAGRRRLQTQQQQAIERIAEALKLADAKHGSDERRAAADRCLQQGRGATLRPTVERPKPRKRKGMARAAAVPCSHSRHA